MENSEAESSFNEVRRLLVDDFQRLLSFTRFKFEIKIQFKKCLPSNGYKNSNFQLIFANKPINKHLNFF